MKYDSVSQAMSEMQQSIKDFSISAQKGGEDVGNAMANAAHRIDDAWGVLNVATQKNKILLESSEATYKNLGEAAEQAARKGTAEGVKECEAITKRQTVLGGVIEKLKDQNKILDEQREKLNDAQKEYNRIAEAVQKSNDRTASFKQQLRNITQEMAMQEAQARKTGGETAVYALRATDAYKQMQIQAAQLTDALGDAQQQAKILANDNAGLQGVISAVGGVAGAFSVAQGAVGLFSDKNEELQQVMVKVQSVMAITMGLQQVANTLNKDSAASLTIFNKVREAYAETYTKLKKKIEDEIVARLELKQAEEEATEAARDIAKQVNEEAETMDSAANALEKATRATKENVSATEVEKAAQEAGTVATEANAAATEMQTAAENANTTSKKKNAAAEAVDTAQTAGNTAAKGASAIATRLLTKATIGLAAGLRAVGAAMKAILPLAVIGGIIAAIAAAFSALTKRSREAKKAQDEFYQAAAEGAKEPIAEITRLQAEYDALGVNVEKKKKFIEDNKEAFKKLGVEVNNLADAERLLNSQTGAFVQAQIERAKALAYQQKAAEKAKEIVEKQLQLEQTESKSGKNSKKAIELRGEIAGLTAEMQNIYGKAVEAEKEGSQKLKEAGIATVQEYTEGMVGWYEKMIAQKREALKKLTDPKEYAATEKEIKALQKKMDAVTGAKNTSGTGKDPFKERLEKQKQQYTQYAKWRNSTDEILQQAAATQFQTLLQQGSNYLDYLRRQRDKLMSEMTGGRGSKKQREQLATINNAIAEETKSTVLEQFDQELQRQLNGANSLIEKLAIIERKRRELANDGSELDQAQAELLQKQREQVANEIESQYRQAQQNYYDYLESKLTAFEKYQKDMAVLQEQYNNAQSSGEANLIAQQMLAREKQYDLLQQQQYDQLTAQYATFEEKRTRIANDYAEKRRVIEERMKVINAEIQAAEAAGDVERMNALVEERKRAQNALDGLNRAEKEAIKELATEYLNNDIVTNFLESAEGSTVQKLDQLIKKLKERSADLKIPVEVDDAALKELIEKLEKLKKEAKGGEDSMKKLGAAIAAGDWGAALEAAADLTEEFGQNICDVYNQVISSMKELGIAGDEQTQKVLDDVGGVIQGTTDLAAGLASGNYMQAIAGGITLVTSAIKLWDDANRENYDTIKAAEAKVKEFESAIKKMRNTLARTYDSSRYDLQREIQDKLAQEIAEEKRKLEAMQRDMQGSSSDYTQEDIDAQIAHIEDLEEQLTQGYEALAEDLTQTTIPEIGQQITDALVDAFANGLDAANIDKELEKVVNDILKNTALNLIKTNLLMPQIKEWYEAFNAALDDNTLTEDEVDALRADLMARMQPFKDAIEAWNEIWGESEDSANTLSGALKGASQESIDLLAGYTNATRIIEQSQLDIMTRQLSHIASIDARLEQAVTILAAMSRRTGLVTETVTAADINNTNERAYGIIND